MLNYAKICKIKRCTSDMLTIQSRNFFSYVLGCLEKKHCIAYEPGPQ